MTHKILVVDDEPDMEFLVRQKFRRQVQEGHFHFIFARNGIDALQKLVAEPDIEMILTDINMPEMDGLTFLSKLAELDNLIKAVIITAYGDMENIRIAMNRGAFDFLTKPIDFNDLEVTIRKTLDLIGELRRAVATQHLLTSIENEMDIARNLQQSILPKSFPGQPQHGGLDMHAMMIPARRVGGDFYDFFFVDPDHLGLIIADVCGKGIPAALFMMMSRTIIRTQALLGLSPDKCLKSANNMLCADNPADMFVTVFYGLLDTKSGHMRYSNGGHNPPFIIDARQDIRMLDIAGGMALGVFSDTEYPVCQTTLQPGDALLLYTDGITEAENAHGVFFTEQRLKSILKNMAGMPSADLIKTLLDSVKDFTGATAHRDDITALALRFITNSTS